MPVDTAWQGFLCNYKFNVFIETHDYSNTFVFISALKVSVICCSITLNITFATLGQLATEIFVIL